MAIAREEPASTGNPYQYIRYEIAGPVAEVILDNPARMNAMAPGFFPEIRTVFNEIDQNESIRAAILWAEGKHFTSGLDLKEAGAALGAAPHDGTSEAQRNLHLYKSILDWQDCFSAVERCRKPVIAAVHGLCLGGGVDLTTACDIRLCSQDAAFAIQETKIAIVADLGTLQRITGIIGKGPAREMAYTGNRIPTDRALRWGLVNDVFPDKESLLIGARQLAQDIAENSPLAVQGAKKVLQYSEEHGLAEGLEYVAQWNSSFLHSADLLEAMTAFMEKRPPEFKGR